MAKKDKKKTAETADETVEDTVDAAAETGAETEAVEDETETEAAETETEETADEKASTAKETEEVAQAEAVEDKIKADDAAGNVPEKTPVEKAIAEKHPLRRKHEEFTANWQGQKFQCLATKGDNPAFVVGFTNDASGGGLIEYVESHPELSKPAIVTLDDSEIEGLKKAAYAPK